MVTLTTLGIKELLAGSKSHGARPVVRIPRHIDYLSLDVEGQVTVPQSAVQLGNLE